METVIPVAEIYFEQGSTKTAKPGTDESVNGDAMKTTIYLISPGKGGVGKSVVATRLAEYLIKRGKNVRCIDGDPVNRSRGVPLLDSAMPTPGGHLRGDIH